MSQIPKPATFRMLGALALPFALMIGGCNSADEATQPMDAADIPENQGLGGANDGTPTGTPSGGAMGAANPTAEDNSAADGTTPTQTQP